VIFLKILITGAAGFIGFHLSKKLISKGINIVGIDNLNEYYDVNLKKNRVKALEKFDTENKFTFHKIDIVNKEALENLFKEERFDVIINLAAQAGVRYSLENPFAYINSNLVGFVNLLELSKEYKIKHFMYASSSSVYGANKKIPFSEDDNVDYPVSLYAATKKSNELIAHSYSHLYGLPTTGLRFFTVYGPWGRPDMAYYKFVKNIYNNLPIKVYNYGDMQRDFTYIDDVVKAIEKLIVEIPIRKDNLREDSNSNAPYVVYNIGNNNPETLTEFIKVIESATQNEAIIEYEPLQKGDVKETYADTKKIEELIQFKPNTDLKVGIGNFVAWYKDYYNN
jgi:UDP-glucuronate 4-epimerase